MLAHLIPCGPFTSRTQWGKMRGCFRSVNLFARPFAFGQHRSGLNLSVTGTLYLGVLPENIFLMSAIRFVPLFAPHLGCVDGSLLVHRIAFFVGLCQSSPWCAAALFSPPFLEGLPHLFFCVVITWGCQSSGSPLHCFRISLQVSSLRCIFSEA